MKNITTFFMAATLLVTVVSCDKSQNLEDVSVPIFEVSTSSLQFKAGEPIEFNFIGNPDYITFYSGDVGNRYTYRDKVDEKGTLTMEFTTSMGAGSQGNNVRVMVSKDFNGVYTAEEVEKADWQDITDRVPRWSSGAALSSLPFDITDIADSENAAVYLAFYYYSPQDGLIPKQQRIQLLDIKNKLEDGREISLFTNFAAIRFKGVDVQHPDRSWEILPVSSPTSINMPAGKAGDPPNEDWAISGPIRLTSIPPDRGTPLKGMDIRLDQYIFPGYAAPGTYTATFEATNASVKGEERVLKEVSLIIVP